MDDEQTDQSESAEPPPSEPVPIEPVTPDPGTIQTHGLDPSGDTIRFKDTERRG